jgi:hypothetical protein
VLSLGVTSPGFQPSSILSTLQCPEGLMFEPAHSAAKPRAPTSSSPVFGTQLLPGIEWMSHLMYLAVCQRPEQNHFVKNSRCLEIRSRHVGSTHCVSSLCSAGCGTFPRQPCPAPSALAPGPAIVSLASGILTSVLSV